MLLYNIYIISINTHCTVLVGYSTGTLWVLTISNYMVVKMLCHCTINKVL